MIVHHRMVLKPKEKSGIKAHLEIEIETVGMIMEVRGVETEEIPLLTEEKALGKHQGQAVTFCQAQILFLSKQILLYNEEENLLLEIETEATGLGHENVFYLPML